MIHSRRKFYTAIICMLLSSSMLYFALGNSDAWFLMWLYPIPIMLYSYIGRPHDTILVSLVAFISGCITVLLHRYIMSVYPVPLEIIPSLLHGMVFTLIIVLNQYAARRLPFWLTIFIFPAFWTTYQFIWSYAGITYFTHFGLSTQVYYLPLLQVASLAGQWGITFLVSLVASGIATAWFYRHETLKGVCCLLIAAIIFGSGIGFGYYRLDHSLHTRSITVGLVARDTIPLHKFAYATQQQMDDRIKRYPLVLSHIAKHHPLFIVTPEIWLQLNDQNMLPTLHTIQQVAKKYDTNIISAVKLLGDKQAKVNTAWVINQQGKLIGQYDKIHLIPEIESNLVPGCCERTFTLNGVKFAIALGSDTQFSEPAKTYGKLGAQILFSAAADDGTEGVGRERRQVAIMAATASGMALARTAVFGELTLADPYGRIIESMDTIPGMQVSLIGKVPLGFGHTFYADHPHWFIILCVFLILITSTILILRLRSDHKAAMHFR